MSNDVSVEGKIFRVPERWKKRAYVSSMKQYNEMWQRSIADPDGFWAEIADEYVTCFKRWDKVSEWDWQKSPEHKWFINGKLNVSYNCLDRHLEKGGDKTAIIFEGNDPADSKEITYRQLHEEVCKFANVLKANGGFSADSLRDRVQDCGAKVLVSCDGTFRGAKAVPTKNNADEALKECHTVETNIVVKRANVHVDWNDTIDTWYHEEMAKVDADCPAEEMDAEDPLFILYTSGSTGKPKGVLHTSAGYLVFVAFTHKVIFDYHEDDIFWCTADIGWVTGHSYIVYGPLCNGATTIIFEGVPTYPDPGRFWDVVDKYKVNLFYTAPTAIRAIAKEGDAWVEKHDLSSLELLGTVGEPINPEAWMWYYNLIGKGRCPIVDTWWQTETGGILITPLPGAVDIKPGSATLPFFGVEPCIVDDDGNELEGACQGALCIKRPWPGLMRGVYGDPERFGETYFVQYPGKYTAGDGARRDEDGYYWITGRIDDVINVSGHRMGTAEVESALVSHPKVAEAAVVGYPHEIKGTSIYAFVTLNSGVEKTDELKKELVRHVRTEIGPIATPEKLQWADGLPKTRSGKIMRRILKKIAAGDIGDLGDTTTLADPSVVEKLVAERIM